MTIEFSFFKNDNKELSLKEARKGDVALPVVSAQAVSGIDKILNALREKNQDLAVRVDGIRNSKSFTATLKPESSGYFSLTLSGNTLGIQLSKLSPKTAEGLLNSTKSQPVKVKNDEPDVVELPNPDFKNPAAILDMTARRNAELLRSAVETPDAPKARLHPHSLPAPIDEFYSVKKDPSYENTAKNLHLMKSDIDKTIDRQTTSLQSIPLGRKKELIKALLRDVKARDLAQESDAQKLMEKISQDTHLLLESNEPVAVSFLDHVLSCKTALFDTQSNFLKELKQLSKALEIGLSLIRIQQLSRQSEELEIKFNDARHQREGTHTFTLKELDEFLENLPDEHIKQRHALYRTEFCQRHQKTYNANLAKIQNFEEYLFRRIPRPVAALKGKISALISSFHALPNYQKWKDLNEVIIKLLALMDEASTCSIWKQPILAPQIMYQGNQMKNLLEEVSKNSSEENLVKFQLLMEELFRSEMEELMRKTSKTSQDTEEALNQMRASTPITEGYNWISAYTYKLRTENAKLRKEAESNQNMMDETSTLMKLSEDLKILRKLHAEENPSSDLYKRITELENQQYALPIRCIEHHKKANLSETNPLAKKIENIHQNYSQIEKQRYALPALSIEHQKYRDLLESY